MGMIGIINIGLGNVDSVGRAVKHIGHDYLFCHEPSDLEKVDKIIFPGVGSFGAASNLLTETGFRNAIRKHVLELNKPILGICLGMQLLAESGTEGGGGEGLGLIRGTVELHRGVKLNVSIPHIGWNDVNHNGGRLFEGIKSGAAFYFVHSFEFLLSEPIPEYVATTGHGVDFVSAVESGHIFGTQFHPEKSQEFGLKLLGNYIKC